MMKTRREFLGCGTCALLVLGCGDKSSETPSFEETGQDPDTNTEESFDPCATTPENGWVEILLSDYPALQEVNGYTTTTVGGNPMIIAHISEGCDAAVASNCTHEGGEIYYSAERQQFSCLEHAATFQLDGEWALGQIAANLKSYLVSKEGDKLLIEV